MSRPRNSARPQVFGFRAPDALSVQLVGDFTEWEKHPVNLAKDPAGIWRVKIQLKPGTYHYRFLVDGEWRDDPECTLRVANAFGTENMVRQVK